LSEALALEWQDIDLKKGSVSVKKTLSELNGICEVAETKTKGSNRRVELGSLALEALKARHRPKARGYVFTTGTGGHPRRSNLRQREFNPICRVAGIEGLTIHGLRHSATSLALSPGRRHPGSGGGGDARARLGPPRSGAIRPRAAIGSSGGLARGRSDATFTSKEGIVCRIVCTAATWRKPRKEKSPWIQALKWWR
jgi:hypothetical protein